MVKRTLKRGLHWAASLLGPHRWPNVGAPRLLILTYHRVLSPEHRDRHVDQPGMIIEPDTLQMHLEELPEFFEMVHLDEWVASAQRGEQLPRRACAITFDDGWRDNFDQALPLLEAAGIPATVFLVSDLVGTRQRFWPNRLTTAVMSLARSSTAADSSHPVTSILKEIGLPPEVFLRGVTVERIDHAIEAAKCFSDDAISKAVEAMESAVPREMQVDRDLLSWDEVRAMLKTGLVRIGSHTRRHVRLRGDITAADLESEIVGSQQNITERTGSRPTLFCFPNGDYCAAALDMVRDCYEGALTTRRGWNHSGTDSYLLRRVGLHDDVSRDRVALLGQISGFG